MQTDIAPVLGEYPDYSKTQEATFDGPSDVVGILLKRRSPILWSTLLGGVVAAAISLFLTPLYTATTLILPPARPQSMAATLLGPLSSMAGSFGPSLGLKDPGDLYIGILKEQNDCR